MKTTWKHWLIIVAGFTAAVGLNYLMALAGEPRAEWLFRDLLHLIP